MHVVGHWLLALQAPHCPSCACVRAVADVPASCEVYAACFQVSVLTHVLGITWRSSCCVASNGLPVLCILSSHMSVPRMFLRLSPFMVLQLSTLVGHGFCQALYTLAPSVRSSSSNKALQGNSCCAVSTCVLHVCLQVLEDQLLLPFLGCDSSC